MTRSKAFFVFLLLIPCVWGQTVVQVTRAFPAEDSPKISVGQFEEDFYREFKGFVQTRTVSQELDKLKKILQDGSSEISLEELPLATEPHTCLLCRVTSYSFLQYNATFNSDTKKLASIAADLCNLLSLDAAVVCEGMIQTTRPVIDYILRNSTQINADRICSIWYQSLNCGETDRLTAEYPVNNPHPEPPTHSKKATAFSSKPPLVLVHLSDFHFDPYYAPGSNAQCDEYICCRNGLGATQRSFVAAGFWGDYHPCDSPWHTVEDIVRRVKQEYSHIDVIYYTGDIVDHFSWATSIEHNSQSIERMTQYLSKSFPGVPLYPVLGNHEAHPANSIAPSYATGVNISTQWLFDLIHTQWGPLLPEEDRDTLRLGGFYSTIVRPKLRLIAVNNNFCFGTNLWLLHSTDYFADHLHWFRDELAKAAENEEKVHVISHIPASDTKCFRGWAREYRKIVEEFSEIIVGVFNGHTHEDEFNVYYSDKDPSKATGVAFNGGSGTTFAFFNSNFKVYSVDAESFEVLDFDEWHYNLTEANEFPNRAPKWQKTYSFKDAYGLQDLSPDSLDGLAQRLGKDRDLLMTYWERKEKYSDWMLREGCDAKCLRKNFCDIVTMVHGDNRKCDELYRL